MTITLLYNSKISEWQNLPFSSLFFPLYSLFFLLNAPIQASFQIPTNWRSATSYRRLFQWLEEWKNFQTLLGVTGSENLYDGEYHREKPNVQLSLSLTTKPPQQLAQEFKEFFPENALFRVVLWLLPARSHWNRNLYRDRSHKRGNRPTLSCRNRESLVAERCNYCSVRFVYLRYRRNVTNTKHRSWKSAKMEKIQLNRLCRILVQLQFKRTSTDFKPGNFRIMGDTLDIYPWVPSSFIPLNSSVTISNESPKKYR